MKKYIFILITIVILGMVFFLAYLNHNDFERAMVNQAESQLLMLAKTEVQSMQAYITDIKQELEILSGQTVIREMVANKRGKSKADISNPSLEDSYKDIKEWVDTIYLIDSKGLIVSGSPFKEGIIGRDLSSDPEVKAMLVNHQAYISPVFRAPSGRLAIAAFQPIFEKGKFVGLLRAMISIDRINDLVRHINSGNKNKTYVWVINRHRSLLCFPDASFLGMDILNVTQGNLSNTQQAKFEDILKRMISGKEGAEIFDGLLSGYLPGAVTTIVAYVPIGIDSDSWFLAVAMDYNVISGPINRNFRDNIIFGGYVFLILIILGIAFYRTQKKKSELAISTAALNIINRQLHLEIGERKRIEKELKSCLTERVKRGH